MKKIIIDNELLYKLSSEQLIEFFQLDHRLKKNELLDRARLILKDEKNDELVKKLILTYSKETSVTTTYIVNRFNCTYLQVKHWQKIGALKPAFIVEQRSLNKYINMYNQKLFSRLDIEKINDKKIEQWDKKYKEYESNKRKKAYRKSSKKAIRYSNLGDEYQWIKDLNFEFKRSSIDTDKDYTLEEQINMMKMSVAFSPYENKSLFIRLHIGKIRLLLLVSNDMKLGIRLFNDINEDFTKFIETKIKLSKNKFIYHNVLEYISERIKQRIAKYFSMNNDEDLDIIRNDLTC